MRMCSLKFVSRVPQKKLNPKQCLKRLNWAKCYQTKGSTFWNRVIFIDESSFTLPISKKENVWRKHDEQYNPKCIRRVVKHPSSVMVWGCMSSNGLGKLVFVEGIYLQSKIFGVIKFMMQKKHVLPKTKTELKQSVLAFWESYPREKCHKLILSLPRRCAAVIKQKGFPTKY